MKKQMLGMVLAAVVWMTGAAVAQDAAASGPVKDDLFAGASIFEKNAASVTEITQGPRQLDLVNGKDGGRAHRTILNVVRTYSYDKPGMFNMADVEVIRKKLETGGWECSVHTRELKSGSSTDICDKPRADGLKESAIVIVSPQSLCFIHTIKKPGTGDQSRTDSSAVSFGFHGSDLAMLDGEMAGMDAKLNALGDGTGSPNTILLRVPREGGNPGVIVLHRDELDRESKGAELQLKLQKEVGPDGQILMDKDMGNPAPGNSVRLKVLRPDAEPMPAAAPALTPAVVPAPQP
jgi:hypothetical protein